MINKFTILPLGKESPHGLRKVVEDVSPVQGLYRVHHAARKRQDARSVYFFVKMKDDIIKDDVKGLIGISTYGWCAVKQL
jgi:hypothetical protein